MMEMDKFPWMICFSRNGMSRFISHLDWLAMVERIFIRAALPVVYSEGFRPRMIIKATPPLPIGVESKCELVQIFLRNRVDAMDATRGLVSAVPSEFGVEWVQPMRFMPPKNPYKAIVAADYTFSFKDTLDKERRVALVELLSSLKPEPTEGDSSTVVDAAMKPILHRVAALRDVEDFIEGRKDSIGVIGKMDNEETLHAAKLGFFLYEKLPLEHYPRIVKTGYLRSTPGGYEQVFVR